MGRTGRERRSGQTNNHVGANGGTAGRPGAVTPARPTERRSGQTSNQGGANGESASRRGAITPMRAGEVLTQDLSQPVRSGAEAPQRYVVGTPVARPGGFSEVSENAGLATPPVAAPSSGGDNTPVLVLRTAERASWGWLPLLALTGAFGLLFVAQAMRMAARTAPLAEPVFWLGLLLIYTPAVFRLARAEASRGERIGIVVLLGLALYLVKVLREPTVFEFHDEFPHWRTAFDIATQGRLFNVNSLQEISAAFPGLEIVAAALAELSGMSLFAAGTIVVGVARLIAVLALYLLYEEITGSPQLAALGASLAIVYPNFVFWSSQFGYESLALPLATVVLFLITRHTRRADAGGGLAVAALLLLVTVIVTHHLTSYWLVSMLLVIFIAARLQPRLLPWVRRLLARAPARLRGPLHTPWAIPNREVIAGPWGEFAFISILLSVSWLVLAGGRIIDYVGPHFRRMAAGVVGFVTGQSAGRSLFDTASPVFVVPTWERIIAFLTVGLIALALPFGMLALWRRYRTNAVALVFIASAVIYPLSLLTRLSPGGAEIANRSWDFLFVALGLLLAAGFETFWLSRGTAPARPLAVAVVASIMLVGGLVVGTPAWARLPGPFMVGGDTRGIQAESSMLADWVAEKLGPDNRVIADYSNKLLLGSYGQQYIVDGASWVYLSPKLDPDSELADLIQREIDYIVVDARLTEQLPRTGVYFEGGEPRAGRYAEPLDPFLFAKFAQEPCLSRVYDSGSISIYRVTQACRGGQ